MKSNIIRKILCFLGIHEWFYRFGDTTGESGRVCWWCGLKQR